KKDGDKDNLHEIYLLFFLFPALIPTKQKMTPEIQQHSGASLMTVDLFLQPSNTTTHYCIQIFINPQRIMLYYPVSILARILQHSPQSRIGILYNTGCQSETHIKKPKFFLDQQPSWIFENSVFHAYVHEWSFQGLKQLWDFLSPLLVSTSRFLGNWLHSKLQGAQQMIQNACKGLGGLHELPNPKSRTAYHLESYQSSQEKQKKELGPLLEEQLEDKWF
ncbi:uncharacterized protein VP01_876g4, partial [Puccinia sorghi]